MEKLTELAKKKSLFDDRAGEVDELSTIIKQVCFCFCFYVIVYQHITFRISKD
jgi:hypothetical protein